MAQANPRPLSAGQRILEFIADRQQYGLQNSLLGNINLFDYMNLRHSTQRILHSLDPVVLQTQNLHNPPPAPAVPLGGPPGPPMGPPNAIPPAAPQNNPDHFLRRQLGAHCDDLRRVANVLNVPVVQHQTPCANGPTAMVRMRPCEQTNPQSHPLSTTQCFNVCDDCLNSWRFHYNVNITNNLPSHRSTLCKRCSLRLRRQHGRGHNACTCRRDIFTGVKCHSCRRQTELATWATGDARRRALERTHIKRTGNSRRKVLLVDNNPNTVRSRPACGTPQCGREAWTKHHSRRVPNLTEPNFSKHDDACLMCLCCGGEYVP